MKTFDKKLRIEREKFRKRKKNFMKKINEFSNFCHTDFYFVMYRDEKYYIYNSINKQN